MNLSELVAEFKARGFDYLTTARCETYVNDAYLIDICGAEDWPFLEASKEGTTPLAVSDLGAVEYVVDTTQQTKLEPLRRSRITDWEGTDLTTTGTPIYYYLTASNTLKTYPVSTDSLLVNYWKVPTRLSGSESPIIPERFHSLIVDAAVARAYEDSDDYELSENAETKFQRRLQKMREVLLTQQHDGADDYVVVTDSFGAT